MIRPFFSFWVVVLIVAGLAGCKEEIAPGRVSGEPPSIQGLDLVTVSEETLSGVASFLATVESRDRALLTARVEGRVAQVAVREGDRVREGDLLLNVRDNQAADRLREAEAAVEESRQNLKSARSRADLTEKTFQRYRRLFENEAVTDQEMDRVSSERNVARQSIEAERAGVERAESARNAARTALSHTRILAPFDAVVVEKKVEEGSTVMPGTPLIVLDRVGGWTVRAEIPESMAGKIRQGEPVRVEVPAVNRIFSTEVSEILSSSDPRSRTFQVKAPLPAEVELASGFFARMIFPAGGREAILIPESALVRRGQLSGVYVVEDGILQYQLVKAGRIMDGRAEILSGLNPGDTIVASETARARSGARVEAE